VGTVARKRIVFSNHALKGLKEKRQAGINEWDVYSACRIASEILTKSVPEPIKLRNFRSKKGVLFDIVIVDDNGELKIVTVIGRRKSVQRQLKKMGRVRRAK
jgi:hypothetical protein